MTISFANKQFPQEVILMAVRWYVAYKLSYRDIEALLAEREIQVDHATIIRWVCEYVPEVVKRYWVFQCFQGVTL